MAIERNILVRCQLCGGTKMFFFQPWKTPQPICLNIWKGSAARRNLSENKERKKKNTGHREQRLDLYCRVQRPQWMSSSKTTPGGFLLANASCKWRGSEKCSWLVTLWRKCYPVPLLTCHHFPVSSTKVGSKKSAETGFILLAARWNVHFPISAFRSRVFLFFWGGMQLVKLLSVEFIAFEIK